MSNKTDRIIGFDLLRTIALLVALPVHYHSFSNIQITQYFEWFRQFYVDVIFVFFFVSGVMGRLVYLSRLNDPQFAKRLFVKGVKLMTLYLAYIVLISAVTHTTITGLEYLLISHPFFLKVYVTLGLLIMITPYLVKWTQNYSSAGLLTLSFVIIVITGPLSMFIQNHALETLLLDYDPYYSPLIPMIGVYFAGATFGAWLKKHSVTTGLGLISIIYLILHYPVILPAVATTVGFNQVLVFIAKVIPIISFSIMLIWLERFSKLNFLSTALAAILSLPGKHSLVFFTAFNVLISLFGYFLTIGLQTQQMQMSILVLIGILSYLSVWAVERHQLIRHKASVS